LKIDYNLHDWIIYFEENDKFADKILFLEGEAGAFKELHFGQQSLGWLTPDETNTENFIMKPVEDELKDELISYIICEAQKQDFHLL